MRYSQYLSGISETICNTVLAQRQDTCTFNIAQPERLSSLGKKIAPPLSEGR